jgi:penicillin amidase
VSTEFSYARPNEGQVAVKRVPLCQTDGETIEGNLAMMRAADAREFSDALAGWSFPTANCVFGDRDGTIGYAAIGAIPVRSAEALQHGRAAHDGTASKYDWQGTIPHDLLPQVLAPDDGVLFSGNHRAIGSFYNLPIGAMTGSGGDTLRSWRLRQLLTTKETFTPEDVLAVHYDTVNPARSEIVRLGLHLRDVLERDLSEDTLIALAVLEPWYNAGASSDLNAEGAALAMELSTFFRVIVTDLTEVYGGGGGGISYFLKTMHARLDENPRAEISSLEQEFIDQTLAGAWNTAFDKYWGDPEDWSATARQMVTRRPLAAFASLDGFGSLDPDADLKFAPITCVDGETIHCQAAQSYTQFVPMHDPDTARTILPIGQSERPGNRWRLSNYELWGAGKLHPAPLSRAAVEEIAAERVTLP